MNLRAPSKPIKNQSTKSGVSGKAHVYPLIPPKDLRLLKTIFNRLPGR